MKKLTLIATGLMMFFGTAVFANNGDKKSKKKLAPVANSGTSSVSVTKEISKSFSSKFSGAEYVNWNRQDEFYFAYFKINKQDMCVAYNADGEILGLSRNLKLNELPIHVEMSIKENCKDFKISDIVTEMVFDGETTYHFQIEDNTRYLKMKADSGGYVSVVKRTKKKLKSSVY